MMLSENFQSALAQAIAQEIVLDNWKYILAFLLVSSLLSALSAYLAASMSKRGEFEAIQSRQEQILSQLRAAENARAAVSYGWNLRQIRRQKLEEIVTAVYDLEDWMSKCQSEALEARLLPESSSPRAKIETLCALYFPNNEKVELSLSELRGALFEHVFRVSDVALAKLEVDGQFKLAGSALEKGLSQDFSQAILEARTNLTQKHADSRPSRKRLSSALDSFLGTMLKEYGSIINVDQDVLKP